MLVRLRLKKIEPATLVSLSKVKGMDEVTHLNGHVCIGCRVSLTELLRNELVTSFCAILALTVRQIGSVQIRNRATLAGNLVNASPAGDSIVALVLSRARLLIRRRGGEREEWVCNFIKGPGKTSLERDEYVRSIILERTDDFFPQFYKVGQRNAMAIAVASVGSLTGESELRLAFGSLAPTVAVPVRAQEYYGSTGKKFDEEEFTKLAMLPLSPIDDVRASARYRTAVAKNLVRKTLAARGVRG